MHTFKPPALLITWFQDQQGFALGLLFLLMLGIFVSRKDSTKLVLSALVIAYAVVAFLTAVAIGASGGHP